MKIKFISLFSYNFQKYKMFLYDCKVGSIFSFCIILFLYSLYSIISTNIFSCDKFCILYLLMNIGLLIGSIFVMYKIIKINYVVTKFIDDYQV